MIRVKARYRDQKLELEQPLNLPEGAEVEIAVQSLPSTEIAEKEAWSKQGMSRLEEEWDNPQDAVYDNWRKLYGA
ncbi:MAG: DUF104 domain-containing protein [Gemmataceae bacterium]|nr:DUF104 domain-containing protein [Gemmataceae bacterium]